MSNPTEVRETPQQTRSKVRREQLLAAAREIVLEEGIDAITTAKIAERADASIGTVYRYWSNVYAILDEILPGRRQTHGILLERAEQVDRGIACGTNGAEIQSFVTASELSLRTFSSSWDRDDLVQALALGLAALEAHDRANAVVHR